MTNSPKSAGTDAFCIFAKQPEDCITKSALASLDSVVYKLELRGKSTVSNCKLDIDMKEVRKFKLQLVDPAIGIGLTLVPIIGFLALFGVTFFGLNLLAIRNPWVAGLYLVAMLAGGGYWGFRAYKKWAFMAAEVVVANAAIIVSAHGHELLAVSFDAIKAYRYQSFNELEELRITLRNEERLKIRASNKLTTVGDFAGMVSSFEKHLNQLSGLEGRLPVEREKAFFEKPISTVLLVAFTILLLFVFWEISHSHKPVRGSLIVSLGSYFSYLSGWLAAAGRRRQA